ncbi:hypothetical protein ACFLZ1_04040 [Patescibacteria group bacterium]
MSAVEDESLLRPVIPWNGWILEPRPRSWRVIYPGLDFVDAGTPEGQEITALARQQFSAQEFDIIEALLTPTALRTPRQHILAFPFLFV